VIDSNMARKYTAELVGTALLVFFGAGMATISFGFRAFGSSVAAGILLTGLTFGLVLLGLVAVIGPISGCHVNPAVTLGQFLARRISSIDAIGYVIAQLIGGILGALLLLWVLHSSPFYSKARVGLGANGYDRLSLLHASAGGAFLIEIVITAVFVLVVMSATHKNASAPVAGLIIGFTLALVNIMGIAIDGASVNPARSLGPAIVVGGTALGQVWLFLIAPMVGALLGAGAYLLFHPAGTAAQAAGKGDAGAERTVTMSAADEDDVRRRQASTGAVTAAPATTTSRATQQAADQTSSGSATKSGDSTGASGTPPSGPDDTTGPVNPPGSMK
jgi:aquaporin Z